MADIVMCPECRIQIEVNPGEEVDLGNQAMADRCIHMLEQPGQSAADKDPKCPHLLEEIERARYGLENEPPARI